jgi:hypothetical protein
VEINPCLAHTMGDIPDLLAVAQTTGGQALGRHTRPAPERRGPATRRPSGNSRMGGRAQGPHRAFPPSRARAVARAPAGHLVGAAHRPAASTRHPLGSSRPAQGSDRQRRAPMGDAPCCFGGARYGTRGDSRRPRRLLRRHRPPRRGGRQHTLAARLRRGQRSPAAALGQTGRYSSRRGTAHPGALGRHGGRVPLRRATRHPHRPHTPIRRDRRSPLGRKKPLGPHDMDERSHSPTPGIRTVCRKPVTRGRQHPLRPRPGQWR